MTIDEFRGENEFLSNFFQRDVTVDFLPAFPGVSVTCPTNEHAFQACKTDDEDAAKLIIQAADASTAKKLGRQVKLIDDWDNKKLDFMKSVCTAKFLQHFDLKLRLLATGEQDLIEGNTWRDDFWGVVKKTGQGHNHLGKILMEIRTGIRNSEGNTIALLEKFLADKGLDFIGTSIAALHMAALNLINEENQGYTNKSTWQNLENAVKLLT